MSFAHIIGSQTDEEKKRASEWEHVFLELQVLLALADEQLDSTERMTLSILSLARDEQGNMRHVEDTIDRVEQQGLSQVAQEVMERVGRLLSEEPAELRSKIADHILKESLSVVAADGIVSHNERLFVVYRLAPGLGIEQKKAEALLDKLDDELTLMRIYVERSFEMYVLLVDESPRDPVLNSRDGAPLTGFLGAVDALVVQHSLGSSRVVSYFLSALGGTLWVDRHQTYINYLSRLAVQVRELKKTSGRTKRLQFIAQELRSVRDGGRDPFAIRTTARHLLNALNKMEGMDEQQIALFRDEICPVIEQPFDELLKLLERRPSMVRLLNNLQGKRLPGSDSDDAWWKFWA